MLFPKELSKKICDGKLGAGNRIMDFEHKKLFDIIGEIAHSIEVRDVAALAEKFDLLENSLFAYFIVEENIAKLRVIDFTQHKFAHQNLLNEFMYIKDKIMIANGKHTKLAGRCYIDALRYCLFQHIKDEGIDRTFNPTTLGNLISRRVVSRYQAPSLHRA